MSDVVPTVNNQAFFHDAFYRFVRIDKPEGLAQTLEGLCKQLGLQGSILLATEGINGMLCGNTEQLQLLREWFEQDSRFAGMVFKRTSCAQQVFKRLKVKCKAEIVPLGVPNIDATQHRGVDVAPLEWRELLKRDDVVLIDNRNHFEYELGHFKGAINPGVLHFRDFAPYFESQMHAWQDKTIAMYCTGGIRCEKTSAWLAQRGLRVLQLEGGIINYFQQLPDASNDYLGTCFVFDERRELDTQAQSIKEQNSDQTP